MKPFAACVFGFYLGTLLYYVNYKIKVIEKKMVEDYGGDMPFYTKFKLSQKMQYYRAYFLHFYRYKIFYFLDEQVVDPLNENVLSPKAFDVYQFKRLIRAMKYDEQKDSSFDFLTIGEDDLEEFDDSI